MKITSFATFAAILGFLPFSFARLSTAKTVQQEEKDFQEEADIISKKNKNKDEGWRSVINVDFQIHHFKSENAHDTNSFDKRLASGVLSQAIAEVFPEMTSNWGFVDKVIEIPEPADDSVIQDWINGYYYYWIPGLWSQDICCRWCPPDLLADSKNKGPSFAKFIQDKERWDKVGELLCTKLRESGYPAYADVSECFVTCGYVSGNDDALIEAATSATVSQESHQVQSDSTHGANQAQFTVHRLQSYPYFSIGTLENAFAVAYNNIFVDSPYSIESVELLRQVNAPEVSGSGQSSIQVTGSEITVSDIDKDDDDNEDDDDEEPTKEYIFSTYWLKLNWNCKSKRCSELLPGQALQQMPLTNLHDILESYVCHNLRESGDVTFMDATGCSIFFEPL